MLEVDFERFKLKPTDNKLEVLFNRIETINNRVENIGQNINLIKAIQTGQTELLETIVTLLNNLEIE